MSWRLMAMDRLTVGLFTRDMTTSPYVVATTTAALASAAVGGLFYAFSTFVMKGLDRAEPHVAIAAMRGINAEAQANAPFLTLFLGSALLTLGVGIVAALRLPHQGTGYVLAGAVLALVAVVVTMAFNVPLNDRLASVDPPALSALDASREWQRYLGTWTAWNHVRTVAPLLGSVLMLVGVRHR